MAKGPSYVTRQDLLTVAGNGRGPTSSADSKSTLALIRIRVEAMPVMAFSRRVWRGRGGSGREAQTMPSVWPAFLSPAPALAAPPPAQSPELLSVGLWRGPPPHGRQGREAQLQSEVGERGRGPHCQPELLGLVAPPGAGPQASGHYPILRMWRPRLRGVKGRLVAADTFVESPGSGLRPCACIGLSGLGEE